MPAKRSTTSSTRKASRLSVRSCISSSNCYLDLLLIQVVMILQKKTVQCNLCGKIISRAADLGRHMKTHDPNAKFVLLFSNSLSTVIDTYFVGNSRVLGRAVSTLPSRNRIWTHTIEDSMYYSSYFFPGPSLMHPNVVSKGDKPFICTDHPKCKFRSCDHSSLNRHQKNGHDHLEYDTPQAESSSPPPTSPVSSSSGIHSSFSPPETTSSSLDHDSILSLYYDELMPVPSMDSPLLFPGSPPPCNWDSMSRLAEVGFLIF
jgi:hypothetical protein